MARTGRVSYLVHILSPGWHAIAECGAELGSDRVEGSLSKATCRRCRSIWWQHCPTQDDHRGVGAHRPGGTMLDGPGG